MQFLFPSCVLAVLLRGCEVHSEEVCRSIRSLVELLVTTGLLHSPRVVFVPLAEKGVSE